MKGDGSANGDPQLPTIPEATYTDREEIARGGLGRVLRATDRSMGRVVAIKELLPESDIDEARFVREALVTGRLEHPSIVPVYEAGRWPSGEPFYTMKLVSGRSLREIVRETTTNAERLALLPHVIDVAEALAYAHSKHVIHRDVKPANVVIGQFGETVVIDWGLAKDLSAGDDERGIPALPSGDPAANAAFQSPAQLTQFGDVMGTPAYMAPEQARGERVDERADVYSLGALLYYVLAGVAPHEATVAAHAEAGVPEATGTDYLTQVAMRPPIPLGERRPGVPGELVAIVEKALAHQPEQRYPTAKELADDLKAFLTGRMVSAHRYTTWERVMRWLRRNRVAVAVAGVAAALLVAGAAVSVKNIVDARDVAEARAYDLTLMQARASLASDPTATLAWLKTYPAEAPNWREARALVSEAIARGVARDVFRLGAGPIAAVAVAPDGETFGLVAGDGTLRLREPGNGAWRTLGSVGTNGGALAFSPDGKTIAGGGNDKKVVLFPGGKVLGEHDDTVNWVTFSPDGKWVASTSTDRSVRLWPVAGGPPVVLSGHELTTNAVAFSPDGTRLATGGEDAMLRIWDVATHETLQVLHAERSIIDLSFAPDGKRLAAAGRAGVSIWDLEKGTARPLGDRRWGEAYVVVWHPSGRLVTAGTDGLGVWEVGQGTSRWLAGHQSTVNAAALTPAGDVVISGGADGTVRVWPLRRPAGELLREDNHPGIAAARPRVSPDGSTIAAPGQDGTILIHRAGATKLLVGHEGQAREVVFSPDGKALASVGLDRTIRLWDLTTFTGRVVHQAPTLEFRLRFSADGQHLAFTQGFEELDVIEIAGGPMAKTTCAFRGKHDSASELSPDGKQVAFVDGYEVHIGDLATCTERLLHAHRGDVLGMAWSPDGRLVASGAVDRTVLVTPAAGGRPLVLQAQESQVYAVHFSPDGKVLVSTGFDGVVWLWDPATGKPLRALRGHDKIVLHAVFTPDSKTLVTSGADDTVRVWEVATGDLLQRETETGHGGVAVAEGGRVVVSSGPRGLRLWPLDRRDAVPADPGELARFMQSATAARIVAGGQPASIR